MGGSLEYKELQPLLEKPIYKHIKYFVETGTYHADTSLMAANHFERVYTTEIKKELYEKSKQKAIDLKVDNINFYLGDSVELLKEIVPNVSEGAVYFIDAHISGQDSGYNGKQLVPLYEELKVILGHKIGPSIFIFDDVRLFDKYHDWAGITPQGVTGIFQTMGYKIKTAYIVNDRLFVLTKI